jgi:hypothetical protein
MWVMQSYLQPDVLAAARLGAFDAWAAAFGRTNTALELAPDGGSYRMQTWFARFTNLPELLTMYRQVADVRTADELGLPTPDVTGEDETVVVPSSDGLRIYVADLERRRIVDGPPGPDPAVEHDPARRPSRSTGRPAGRDPVAAPWGSPSQHALPKPTTTINWPSRGSQWRTLATCTRPLRTGTPVGANSRAGLAALSSIVAALTRSSARRAADGSDRADSGADMAPCGTCIAAPQMGHRFDTGSVGFDPR